MEIDTKDKWQMMCRRNIIKSDLVGKFEDTSLKLLSLSYLLVKSFFSCRNLVVCPGISVNSNKKELLGFRERLFSP